MNPRQVGNTGGRNRKDLVILFTLGSLVIQSAFEDLTLTTAGSLVLGPQQHRTLGRAGRRASEPPSPVSSLPAMQSFPALSRVPATAWVEARDKAGAGWCWTGVLYTLWWLQGSLQTSPFDWKVGSHPVGLGNVMGL